MGQLLDGDPRHLLLNTAATLGLFLLFEGLGLHVDVFFGSTVQKIYIEIMIDTLFLSFGLVGLQWG